MAQLSFNETAQSWWRSASGEGWPRDPPGKAAWFPSRSSPCHAFLAVSCAALKSSQAGYRAERAHHGVGWLHSKCCSVGSLQPPAAALCRCASVSPVCRAVWASSSLPWDSCLAWAAGQLAVIQGRSRSETPQKLLSMLPFAITPGRKVQRLSLALLVVCLLNLAFSNERLEPMKWEVTCALE